MNKTIALRFARGLGAVVLGFLASFIVGDDVLGLVPDTYDPLVIGVVAPALLALEKFLRDGGAGDAPPRVAAMSALGVGQPSEAPAPEPDPEPQMSARKLAGLRGTAEDPLTHDGQPKR